MLPEWGSCYFRRVGLDSEFSITSGWLQWRQKPGGGSGDRDVGKPGTACSLLEKQTFSQVMLVEITKRAVLMEGNVPNTFFLKNISEYFFHVNEGGVAPCSHRTQSRPN